MRKLLFILSVIIPFFSFCQSTNSLIESDLSNLFEKSFKEQKRNGLLEDKEDFDETKNIYSNYYYNISFDGPDDWATDDGTAENIIYRTYESKFGVAFSIDVVERKSRWQGTTWDFHKKNESSQIEILNQIARSTLKTEFIDLEFNKSFIKNYVSTKTSFRYNIRNLDKEYLYKSIQHKVFIEKFQYTFALQLPLSIYQSNPDFYDNLFSKITFLPDKKRIYDIVVSNGQLGD